MLIGAANPYFEHCDFMDNKGFIGGVVTNSLLTAPVFNRCTFTGNQARGVSVLLNMQGGDAVLTNCLINNNVNTGFADYQMIDPMQAELYSNSIVNNNESAKVRLINSTIANNKFIANESAGDGPLIANLDGSTAYVTNSIVWGNTSNEIGDISTTVPSKLSYSLIQGLAADVATHMQDGLGGQPVFIDTANGNFQLRSPSPLINSGINDSLTLALAPYLQGVSDGGLDLAGHIRIVDAAIDLGAYEFSDGSLPITLYYFNASWKNGLTRLDWKSGIEGQQLDHYNIEKSINGKDFYEISVVPAKGSNSTYDFKTLQLEQTAYYRLKAIQTGGKFDFSDIKKVVQQVSGQTVKLYPNPAKNDINIQVEANSRFFIYSAGGILVKTVTLRAGANKVDISQLSAGAYFGVLDGQKFPFVKE